MTTIVVVKDEAEIIMGADTLIVNNTGLVETGNHVSPRSCLKIYTIATMSGEVLVGMCGSVKFIQLFTHCLAMFDEPISLRNVDEVYTAVRVIRSQMEQHDLDLEEHEVEMLIANAFGIFSVDEEGNVLEYQRFHAVGSGAPYALGSMHSRRTSSGAMSTAKAALKASAEFDHNTQGPFNFRKVMRCPTLD